MDYSPQQILEKVWFTKKESDIFLTCLTYWWMTVTWLQRQTKLPRTTIYDTLQKLELKGYISKNKRNQTLTFYAISIQELAAIMEDKVQHRSRKKDLLLHSTDQFQQLMRGSHVVPQVKMYLWDEALHHIFQQIKQSKTIRTMYSPETLELFIPTEHVRSIHKAHETSKTHKKVLLVPDSRTHQEADILLWQWFEVRIVSDGFPVHADIVIMDEKMYFLQYSSQIQVIEIIQPVFVNAQKALFDLVWENARKIEKK